MTKLLSIGRSVVQHRVYPIGIRTFVTRCNDSEVSNGYTINPADVICRPVVKDDLPKLLQLLTQDNEPTGFRIYSPAAMETIFRVTRSHPEAFFVAEWNNKMIGTALVKTLGGNLSRAGTFTVDKSLRARGLASILLPKVFQFIGQGNGGVIIMKDIEKSIRSGFNEISQCVFNCVGTFDKSTLDCAENGVDILAVDAVHPADVVKYDANIAPREESDLMFGILDVPGMVSRVAVRRGQVVGFGAIDTTHAIANIIGPLYADDITIMKQILHDLSVVVDNRKPHSFSFPFGNKMLPKLLKENSQTISYQSMRLVAFTKEVVRIPEDKIFAMANPAVFLT